MWLVRIEDGVEYPAVRVDDVEGEQRRPRQARGWKFKRGAAAFSQSPEGALSTARAVLLQPENSRRVTTTFAELMETMQMKGSV